MATTSALEFEKPIVELEKKIEEMKALTDTLDIQPQIDELERQQIFTAPLVRELIDEIDNVRTERDALSAYVVAQSDEIERLRKIVVAARI